MLTDVASLGLRGHRRGPTSLADLDSNELASRATGGDVDSFEALVRRYERRVFGYAWHHLHDAEEASDLAQEVFVKLFRGLSRYHPDRPFDAWFWRLVINATIDHAQHRLPIPTDQVPEDPKTITQLGDSDLALALEALGPDHRTPLLLHYYAGLPVEEVARALGVSVSAVKSRMHRARGLLRRALTEAG